MRDLTMTLYRTAPLAVLMLSAAPAEADQIIPGLSAIAGGRQQITAEAVSPTGSVHTIWLPLAVEEAHHGH
jgi:hypothetical protein